MKKEKQAREDSNAASPQPQLPTDPKTAENPVKSAGHPTAENEWFKIGLSPLEVAMLKNIQAKIWTNPENSTRAETIRMMVLGGLAHYKTLGATMFADAEYCKHEGFASYEALCERMIQEQLPASRAGLASVQAACQARRPDAIQAARRVNKASALTVPPSAVAKTPLPEGWRVHGLMDLENEISAAISLIDLLSKRLADFQSDCESENSKNAGMGVMELADRAQSSLRAEFDAAWDYYRSLPGAGAASTGAGKGGAQ